MSNSWNCLLFAFVIWSLDGVSSTPACPSGFSHNGEDGYCYKLVTDLKTWEAARSHCISVFDGDLAIIHTSQTSRFLNKLQGMGMEHWTGLNDRNSESHYVWNEDDPIKANFDHFNKDKSAPQLDCGSLTKLMVGNVMKMRNCIETRGFFCEVPAFRVEETTTTPPAEETTTTPPAEETTTTPPEETTTLSPTCRDDTWKLYDSAPKCIKIIERKVNWQKAREECQRQGADLVTIPDSGTHDFIKGLMGTQRYWIGLSSFDLNGKWYWLNETTETTYTAWANKPRNLSGHEYCVELIGKKDGKWNDKRCNVKRQFICQYSPAPKDVP